MSWWSSLFKKKTAAEDDSKEPLSYAELLKQLEETEQLLKEERAESRTMRKRLLTKINADANQIARFKTALDFYAKRGNWSRKLTTSDDPVSTRDRGYRARKALGQE
jgi:hypothetical protein